MTNESWQIRFAKQSAKYSRNKEPRDYTLNYIVEKAFTLFWGMK